MAAPDVVPMTDAAILTTSATGAATASIRGIRPGQIRRVSRVTIDLPEAGAGTVRLITDGREIVKAALAVRAAANGDVSLHPGQQLDVVIADAPAATQITVTFHYTDEME